MNCLITGASLGIGRALAIKLASLNYNLFLTYSKNADLCQALQQELITKYKIKCFIQKCDLQKEEDIKAIIDSFKTKLGMMDLLINNAATYQDNDIDSKSKKEFMEVLEVNVVGTFLMTKYASKIISNGIVINMASTDGIDTYNEYNIDYAVSKAGIIQLTKSFSLIYKTIKFLAIAPNWVKTESTMLVDKKFLEQEMQRVKQKELLEVETVVEKIILALSDKNLKSGDVIKIYENK